MTGRVWVTLHNCVKGCLITSSIAYEQQIVSDIAHLGTLITSLPDQQKVSNIRHFVKGSLITFLCMTNRKWVMWHILWKAHHIFSMTNSLWVTLHILWNAVSSHLSCNQQGVSEIEHFVKGCWKAVSLHLFLSSTACEWHSTLLWNTVSSVYISSYIWSTACVWHCTLVWKAVLWLLSHLFLWPMAASEWCCTFYARQSHPIFSYHLQRVSGIAQVVKHSLNTFFSMTNSLWGTLHTSVKACLITFFLWPIACEWLCTSCQRQSHHIFPMTNSLWATAHLVWKAISSYSSPWLQASELLCTFLWIAFSMHLFLCDHSMWVMLYILCNIVSSHLFL